MSALTEYERKTLELLRDHGIFRYTSEVGFALFGDAAPNRKKHPSRQGMALAAGRFLGPLQRRGLIGGYKGWSITQAGRQLLATLEATTCS